MVKYIFLHIFLHLHFLGIGDGGNEIGMGKVFNTVVKNISHGEKIACTVKAEMLIASGL